MCIYAVSLLLSLAGFIRKELLFATLSGSRCFSIQTFDQFVLEFRFVWVKGLHTRTSTMTSSTTNNSVNVCVFVCGDTVYGCTSLVIRHDTVGGGPRGRF